MGKGENFYDLYKYVCGFMSSLVIPLSKKDIIISTLQISKLR